MEKKEQLIDIMFVHLSLCKQLKKLLMLLVKHKRGLLFADVLKYIWWEYFERIGAEYVSIQTSHELPVSEIAIFQEYLARLSGKAIIYSYMIDQTLIAGIRMQSNTILWEHSIRKQLCVIRQSCNA